MSKLLLILLLTSPAWGAISVIHSNAAQGSSASPTLAFTTAPTAGNWLGIIVGWNNACASNRTVSSVTDTQSDTILNRPGDGNTATGCNSTRIFYVESAVGGATTVTVNFSASTNWHIQLVEVTGLATSSSFDVDIPGAGGAAVTSITSGTYSTAQASEIAFVEMFDFSNCHTYTAGTGFTLLDATSCAVAGPQSEYQIYSSTQSSVTAAATYTGSAGVRIGGAVFKAAGGAAYVPVGGILVQ